MEIQSRVQKIEEALEHLKYKDNILEFEQPRVDVTDQDAPAEANPPRYCKKFDPNKVQALVARYTKVATNLPGNPYILSSIYRDRFFTQDPVKASSVIGAVTSLAEEDADAETTTNKELSGGLNAMGLFGNHHCRLLWDASQSSEA